MEDLELEVRITDGPEFSASEPLAIGKISCLQNFKNSNFQTQNKQESDFTEQNNTKVEHFNIHLFSSFIRKSMLRCLIGLK